MKKIMAVMLSLLACTVLLAGCNTSSESNEEQSLKVYSFSGENEYISVSNGVIILDGKDEICYGGDLKVMSDDFANITTSSGTPYRANLMSCWSICLTALAAVTTKRPLLWNGLSATVLKSGVPWRGNNGLTTTLTSC